MAVTTNTDTPVHASDYVDGVLGSKIWNISSSAQFEYSFPSAGSNYGVGYAFGENTTNFSQLTAKQQTAEEDCLAKLTEIIPVTFLEITESDATHAAPLRFANSTVPGVAWAYDPTYTGQLGGDAWYGTGGDDPDCGDHDWLTILHETGHTFGLKHAHASAQGNTTVVPADKDATPYTVMTYRSYVGAGTGGYTNSHYPQTYMTLDVQALQHAYGANTTIRSSGCVVTINSTNCQVSIDGTPWITPTHAKSFFTLPWVTGGDYELDLSNWVTNLDINLTPGEGSVIDSTKLADLGNGNFADSNFWVPYTHSSVGSASIPNRVQPGTGDNTIVFSTLRSDNTLVLSGSRLDYSVEDEGSEIYTLTDLRDGTPNGVTTIQNANFVEFDGDLVAIASITEVYQINAQW